MSINFENISLLVSGCMHILANKKYAQISWTYLECNFVLRLHRPIWLPFCTQAIWTYMIAILCSGHMDLYDLHFALRSHGHILHVWTHSTEALHLLHLDFGLWQLFLPFCTQATWTYMIGILCSGHMDLFCMCKLGAQRLNVKSKSEGMWCQQKIWETLSNGVIAVIIVIVVIPVIMGNSGKNSFCFV